MQLEQASIGLAGAGYWGAKLARNIGEATGAQLSAVADPEPDRIAAITGGGSGVRGYPGLEQMLDDPALDAVVLATPASDHAAGARAALEAGKHVMVEKPLALNSADCLELCALADERGLALMVGHTFAYSEPVRMLRALIAHRELGNVLYAYSQRLNLGLIRDDLNALWNFGPHDVSILLYLFESAPVRVTARQFSLLGRELEDVAFLVLEFAGGEVAHVHLSWLDPRKVRQFTVVGTEKMAVYDDTDVEGPIRIYDKGVVAVDAGGSGTQDPFAPREGAGFGEFKLTVRAGDLLIPQVPMREPLRVEIEHFADCVRSGRKPLTDGRQGLAVVRVLEAAQASADQGGEPIEISSLAIPEDPQNRDQVAG